MRSSLDNSLRLIAGLALAALAAQAAPQTFDFNDPKGVNNVQFKLDGPLESITGTATGISGSIVFDVVRPDAASGRIVLSAASLTVGNPKMGEHLHGIQWLDVAKYLEIVFEASELQNVRTEGTQTKAEVRGTLTIKGVTKSVTAPVSFTYLANKLGARLNDPKVNGDLLVVRTTLQVNRSDFNIMAGEMMDKVGESIQLSLSIAGSSPRA